jgi:hypothetical protein
MALPSREQNDDGQGILIADPARGLAKGEVDRLDGGAQYRVHKNLRRRTVVKLGKSNKALSLLVKQTMTVEAITTSMRSMGKGSWAILAGLLILLVGTIVFSYLGWVSAAGTDVPASGYVALALGVIFSLAVGFGLMALVFYSSRAGYDEPARLVQEDDVTPGPHP